MPRSPGKTTQCAALECETLTVSSAFEFCLPHWNLLKELNAAGDTSFSLKFRGSKKDPTLWIKSIRACVEAVARHEGKELDEEPIT